MQISIIGITGFTGGQLAAELISRGHLVTGGARNTDTTAPEGVAEIHRIDIHEPETLPVAFDGSDAVVVSVQPWSKEQTLEMAIPALLDAAESFDVRLGFIGGAGSLHLPNGGGRVVDQPDFPDAWRPGAIAHAEALEALKQANTTARWFSVSPSRSYGRMVPGEKRGTYRIGGNELLFDAEGESHIGAADFAAAIADELERPQHHNTRFTVGY